VANLIEAQRLILLTINKACLRRPATNPNAKFIAKAEAGDPELERMASGGAAGSLTRRHVTKVRAAARAARSGALTVIAQAKQPIFSNEFERRRRFWHLAVPGAKSNRRRNNGWLVTYRLKAKSRSTMARSDVLKNPAVAYCRWGYCGRRPIPAEKGGMCRR